MHDTATQGQHRITVGAMIVAIGVLHNVVGVLFGVGLLPPLEGAGPMTPLIDILQDGVVAAVEPHLPRMVFFWFVVTGFAVMIAGWFAHLLERRGHSLPHSAALVFGALALGGVVMLPVSGFWFLFVPAVVAWRRARPSGSRAAAS